MFSDYIFLEGFYLSEGSYLPEAAYGEPNLNHKSQLREKIHLLVIADKLHTYPK